MKRRKRLLADQIALTLEEKCAAYLARGLPPDADEFDRLCYEGMARYMELIDQIKARASSGLPVAGRKDEGRRR
jgi:hypothetical protein